jgi:multiple sugar transport system substrate-binding protein
MLAGAALILSGCGAGAEPATGDGIDGVHVTFGGWGGEEAATKADFEGFQSSFEDETGADVEWVGAPWADTQKMLALRASSDPIDVAQLDIGWITSFADKGQLVDLNEVYGKDTLAELYPANLLALGQRDGKQVALPWTIASISMVANMNILEAAGITEVPETTDEFQAALEAIKKSQPDVIPYALNTKSAPSVAGFLQPWIWTFGGSMFDDGEVSIDDNSATADALGYLTGLVDDGLVAKDMDVFAARTLFAEGKVAFYDDAIIARGLVTDPAISDKVVPVPRPVLKSGDEPQSTQWGHALVMFKKDRTDQQLEAAKEFMSWLQNPDVVGDYFTNGGLLPATNAGLEAQDADEYTSAWIDITSTSRPKETDALANGAQILEVIGQHGEAAYNGIESPKDAAHAMAEELKQLK